MIQVLKLFTTTMFTWVRVSVFGPACPFGLSPINIMYVCMYVGLELGQIDVQGTIETQGGGDGADNLGK